MQFARILICIMAIGSPAHVGACEPDNEVCHGCTSICSHYVDDTKLVTDPHCHQRCQADVYNCIEGTLPHEEAAGDRAKCIEEKMLERIREDGDIITKIVYDTPPSFEEFDQLYQEDGKIDSRDMAVFADIMDGGAAADGTAVPTAKVNVIMEAFREADVDGDGVVTEGEFNAYAKGSEHLGHHVEELHPTPAEKPIENAAEELVPEGEFIQQDLALMQTVFRSPKTQKKKFHRKQPVHKKQKQTGLAYFQHLVRLGLRIHRADKQQKHPIGILAVNMIDSQKRASKAAKKQ